jgi:hypothetical protein
MVEADSALSVPQTNDMKLMRAQRLAAVPLDH